MSESKGRSAPRRSSRKREDGPTPEDPRRHEPIREPDRDDRVRKADAGARNPAENILFEEDAEAR